MRYILLVMSIASEAKKSIHRKVFWISVSVLILFRLVLALGNPVWIDPDAIADDILMLNYANIFDHFAHWNSLSMAKTMSYPVFLGLVYVLGIPYNLAVGLLWAAAAFVTLWFFSHYVQNIYGRLLVFAFVLYCPVAFDIWTGLRIYRQGIVAPTALIAVMCIFLLVVKLYLYRPPEAGPSGIVAGSSKSGCAKEDIGALRKIFIICIIAGLSFFYFYYIKEDSLWLAPVLIITSAFSVIVIIRRRLQRGICVKLIFFALLPVIIFTGGTNVYKAVNYHYFGVFGINTRTDGEFGKFAGKLLQIQDENKTSEIWAPFSTLEMAFRASPTLAETPELLESIRFQEIYANGDMVENPIPGDLVFWAIKSSLEETGLYGSERQAEMFFRDVNRELDAAFCDGRLEKMEGIAFSPNTPIRTPEEIGKLWPMIREMFLYQAMWQWSSTKVDLKVHERLATVESVLHVDIPSAWVDLTTANYTSFAISNGIIELYRRTSPVILGLTVAGFICLIADKLRSLKKRGGREMQDGFDIWRLSPVFAATTALSCIVLIVGVAWFIEWLYLGYYHQDLSYTASTILNYYSCGAAPLIMILEIFGISYLLRGISRWIGKAGFINMSK